MIFAKYVSRGFIGRKGGAENPVHSDMVTDLSCRYRWMDFPEFSRWASQPASETKVGFVWQHSSGLPPNFNYISQPSDVVPQNVDVDSFELVDRTMKAKEYLALQEQGVIVLKPMTKYEAKALLLPGAPKDASYHVQKQLLAGKVPFGAQYVGQVCGVGDMQLINTMSGVPCEEHYRTVTETTTSTTTTWHVADVPELELADPHIAYAVWKELLAQIKSREWDTGLITAVTAEANSGAMDVLTEIGEARETVSYLFNLLGSIFDLARKARRDIVNIRQKPGKSVASMADEIASIWMQFRYAVSPIGYSIDDTLSLISSHFSPYQSFRQGDRWFTEPVSVDGYTLPSIEIIDRVFLKHQYSLETKTHNMKFNPLATAWELTPLSFVVDWALNIGDLLSALWVPSNVSQVAAQYSRQMRQSSNVIVGPGASGDIVLNARYYDAQPFDPLVQVGLTFDLNMTTKRWADALSLAWLATKGKLRD